MFTSAQTWSWQATIAGVYPSEQCQRSKCSPQLRHGLGKLLSQVFTPASSVKDLGVHLSSDMVLASYYRRCLPQRAKVQKVDTFTRPSTIPSSRILHRSNIQLSFNCIWVIYNFTRQLSISTTKIYQHHPPCLVYLGTCCPYSSHPTLLSPLQLHQPAAALHFIIYA